MNEQNTKSRREFLTKGFTAIAYSAPVVAILAASKKTDAATPEPAQRMRMRMHMHGHGGHG